MELYIHDWSQWRGILNQYELQWTRRAQDMGEFLLKAPLTAENAALLTAGRVLKKSDDDEAMIIDVVRTTRGKETQISCAGRSGISLLERRIVRVSPTLYPPLMRGNFSQILQTLLNRHAIAPIDARRRLPVIYATDPGLPNETIEKSVSWRRLGTAVCKLCRQYGIGIRTVWNEGVITVKPYPLRQNPIVFSSQFGTLDDQERLISIREFATDAVVGGSGEYPNRHMVDVDSRLSGVDRFERFVDASADFKPEDFAIIDQYYEALMQAGQDALADNARQDEFSASANTNSGLVYKKDYDVGHIVPVCSDWGFEDNCLISEITETYDKNGRTLDITFAPLVLESEDNANG